eukprot:13598560-Alexandrium_andersonii.AAC.1
MAAVRPTFAPPHQQTKSRAAYPRKFGMEHSRMHSDAACRNLLSLSAHPTDRRGCQARTPR